MEYAKYPWIKKVLLVWTNDGSKHFANWISSWGVEPIAVMPVALVLLIYAAAVTDPNTVSSVLAVLVVASPVWLPLFLFAFFWVSWIDYIRYLSWFSTEFIVLEIQLPQEVTKSPLAMEIFLTSLHNAGGETTFIARIWKGTFRPIWSLEIASNEGRIGFYIHLRKAWKNIIEARLYGQYPEAKVIEVSDYTARVPFNLEAYDIFGAEYKKDSPQALPLKTYIDYGLDKNPDTPEIQTDPMSNTLELLSQIGPGEHFWMQILMRARKKDEWYGFYFSQEKYKEEAKAAITNIIKKAAGRTAELVSDDAAKKNVAARGIGLLSEMERNKLNAIERWLTKLVFECGVRVVYLAKREQHVGVNNGSVIRFFDAYKFPEFNSLGATRGTTYFDYPWQDFNHIRANVEKHNIFTRYKQRAYFYVPYDQVPVMLSTEELATIWHLPSSAVQTPGLNRISSRRAEAPPNLPTLPS